MLRNYGKYEQQVRSRRTVKPELSFLRADTDNSVSLGRIYINFFRKDVYTREEAAKFKEIVKAGLHCHTDSVAYTWPGMLVDITKTAKTPHDTIRIEDARPWLLYSRL